MSYPPAQTAFVTLFVHLLHAPPVVRAHDFTLLRIREEEGVVRVPSGVLLRLEERVEIEKTRLGILVRGHLAKTHLQQDFPELLPHLQSNRHLQQGMQVP
jgi:hypothetical protein